MPAGRPTGTERTVPELPSYLVRRPPMPTDAATLAAFEALYAGIRADPGGEIDYTLAAPRWQFLCYLADEKGLLLHGSGNPAIAVFEPRQSDDVTEFGDRKAIYAASDGLWAMYFAILDRARYPMSLINSCVRIEQDGLPSEPLYFFSIGVPAAIERPYCGGTVYLLPRDGFEQQAPLHHDGRTVHPAQWASSVPAVPLARLAVGPEDFPLLAAMRRHDTETTFARARANPDGFPWLDA
jgi:hypothetical protein